jgi:hypothetical protein
MLSPFTILPFLTFLVLCSTTPGLSTGEDSTALVSRQNSNVNLAMLRAQYQEIDITSSGKYNMIFCDADGQGDTKARMLKALLPMFEAQLDQLLLDAQLGTRSTHGYEALFKSRRNKKIVKSVFQKIRNADLIPLSAKRGAQELCSLLGRRRYSSARCSGPCRQACVGISAQQWSTTRLLGRMSWLRACSR